MHIYTPVRRSESTLHHNRLHGDQEQEWTAARCHRLLRALKSRVAILTKEISRFSSTTTTSEPARTHIGEGIESLDPKRDEDWTQGRKRIRRTYSSKGSNANVSQNGRRICSEVASGPKPRRSFVPGEVMIPTPILARITRETVSSPVAPKILDDGLVIPKPPKRKRSRKFSAVGDHEGGFQLSEPLREIRKTMTASRYNVYEGIYTGLEALLRVTAQDTQNMNRKGARSLMSMALRAVPNYIVHEEKQHAARMEETKSKSAIENRDLSSEIYDDLESYGSNGYGWKPLKTIVRSHGIHVVRDAIRKGLLEVNFCGTLIALCLNTSAVNEAQELMSALLFSVDHQVPKSLYEKLHSSVSMLWTFTQCTGRTAFQYRELSNMISNGQLPLGWIATKEFGPIWIKVMQSLSPGSIDEDALLFLETSLSLLSGYFDGKSEESMTTGNSAMTEAAMNTFSSLLTTLTSILILSNNTASTNDTRNCTRNFDHIATLLRSCLAQNIFHTQSGFPNTLLLLANLIVEHSTSRSKDINIPFGNLILDSLQKGEDSASISSRYNDAVLFIYSVACCCGRSSSDLGFEKLEHMHSLLESLVCDRDRSDVLKALIVDSALAFSTKVPNRKHLDYAANLDIKFCSRKLDFENSTHDVSKVDDDSRSGFRWEEGIGEWVTATPAPHISKRNFEEKIREGDECDTPYRPRAALRSWKATIEIVEDPEYQNEVQELLSPDHLEYLTSEGNDEVIENQISGSDNDEGIEEDEQSFFESDDFDMPKSPAFISSSEDECCSLARDGSNLRDGSLTKVDTSFAEKSILSSFDVSSSPFCPPTLDVNRAPRLKRNLHNTSSAWQLFDPESSFASQTSTSSHGSTDSSRRERGFVDRAPRLGRRALQSNHAWHLFNDSESDDELSFVSTSSQNKPALQDITRKPKVNSRSFLLTRRKSKTVTRQSNTKSKETGESEDELCI